MFNLIRLKDQWQQHNFNKNQTGFMLRLRVKNMGKLKYTKSKAYVRVLIDITVYFSASILTNQFLHT